MTTAIAAPAASTTVTSGDIEEDVTGLFEKCFLSHQDFAGSGCMKELIRQHPAAANAPILSDKDICGHDAAFGHRLVAELKRRQAATTGFIILCSSYGLKYHNLDSIQENFLVKRSSHRCSR